MIVTAAVVGQTARTAQIVSEELHKVLLHERSPQDAIRSLQSDVKSFGDACDVLQLLLNGLASSKASLTGTPDEQFHIKIQQAMSEYATTVDQLGQHIRSARSSASSFLRQGWRQSKLGIKAEDLVRARQRLDSHLLSVQLILDILNLRNTLRSSDALDLSTLRSSIQDLHRKKARVRTTSQVNSPHLGQDQKLFASTATLIAEADEALVVATTTYEDCISTRSATGMLYEASLASTTVLTLPTASKVPIVVERPSTSTHDLEDQQDGNSVDALGANTDNVNQWIHGLMSEMDKRQRSSTASSMVPSPLKSNRSYSTVPSDILSSHSTEERLTSNGTFLTEPSISPLSMGLKDAPRSDGGRQLRSALDVVDDSDDDDIEVELAKNVIGAGKTAFDSGDYARARGTLLEGLSLVQQLPVRQQANAYDMLDLRYQLAMCALSLDSDVAVENALVEVLQQEPNSDVQRERLFHVSHILAQLYARTARLGLSRQTCNNALRGRRKLLGKEHDAYYASLGLMARICELQNASLQAQGYMDMIPATQRQQHTFTRLRIEIDDGKEAVVFPEVESHLSGPATLEPTSTVSVQNAGSPPSISNNPGFDMSPAHDTLVSPCIPAQPSDPDKDKGVSPVSQSAPYHRAIAQSVAQLVGRSGSSVRTTRSSCASSSGHVAASPITSPLAASPSYFDAALPTRPSPDNDYLGYCKGAWLLQTGDRKAMKKKKEYDDGRSSNAVYWLSCSDSRCEFATEIEYSVIGTWTMLWRTKERLGITYRWAFLAKSHVRQPNKVAAHQTVYKCMFCAFQGHSTPVMQGSDLYFDHIAREHRGTGLSGVVLHQTCCISDRVCTERDDFDINLHPKS